MMKTEISEITGNFSKDQNRDIRCSFVLAEDSKDTITVNPVGSIDSYNNEYFQGKMVNLLDNGYINLVFNLSSTKYVSAVGIGAFVHVFEKAKKHAGRVIIKNMQKQVLEVFQLPGFSEYFSIDADNGSAVLEKSSKNQVVD